MFLKCPIHIANGVLSLFMNTKCGTVEEIDTYVADLEEVKKSYDEVIKKLDLDMSGPGM